MPTRARESAQDVRKTVTVLFADIVDSSRLSQALDPEALRDVLARYFGEFSAIVGRHGIAPAHTERLRGYLQARCGLTALVLARIDPSDLSLIHI